MRKNKVSASNESMFDNSIGKNTLTSITDLLTKATNQSGSLSKLTDEQISDIYDGVELLKDLAAGKRQDISYSTLNELTQSIFDELPPEIMKDYQDDLMRINQTIKTELKPKFEGDSDLFDEIKFDKFDPNRPSIIPTDTNKPIEQDSKDELDSKTPDNKMPDNKTPDNKMPDNKTTDENTPDETTNDGSVKERTMTSSKVGDLRPRLLWGGTDVLIATKEETNLMNAISDAMSLDEVGWGNGKDNTLFNINNIDTQRRYTNCFKMPAPPKPDPLMSSRSFRDAQAIVWTSQLPPLDNYKNMRDNADFGQYQRLSQRTGLTSTSPFIEIMLNPNEFPAQIDHYSGGEKMKTFGEFNYVINQRFTGRR